ncbi:BREX-5 system adenine-specific DNA-methyltransferase PglX [Haloplanus sp. GCM10025708]
MRMLTDNSLGKLYLEHAGELQDAIEAQAGLSSAERKHRPLSPDESPSVADCCTYLVPSDDGEPTAFDHPEELRVVDPACGSGHFLLYAFDVLERIWWAETDLDRAEIPAKILEHNLYGVDLDMRACQLAAFNLYLKGRTRAEAEGADGFDMPDAGIVCADAAVADVDGVEDVFAEVADGRDDVADALRRILGAFEEGRGLGSLLDVRGTLGDLFEDDGDEAGVQLTLSDDPREEHTLGQMLHSLRDAVDEHLERDSFLAQDLRSFVRLLDVLAQDYDVALMNPPYGSQNRMPEVVKEYVRERYSYAPEFYINFFEVCERITESNGRIGMLVPRSFMYKRTFERFRADFLGERGAFDYLAEFGTGVLDNATVRTVGSVIRSGDRPASERGTFFRLYDLPTERKESAFLDALGGDGSNDGVVRKFTVPLAALAAVPGTPICYATPPAVRELHDTDLKLDAERADVDGESVAEAVQGLATGNNSRFVRKHWEVADFDDHPPFANGGADAWVLPRVTETVDFGADGDELRRSSGSRFQNTRYYRREGLTWTYIKDTGRRFGYFPADGVFSHTGFMLFPRDDDQSLWHLMAALNSDVYHALFLSLTTERHWNVGEVGRIPWHDRISDVDDLGSLGREQYRTRVVQRTNDPTSPFYVGPSILPVGDRPAFFYDHPHQQKTTDRFDLEYDDTAASTPIEEAVRDAERAAVQRRRTVSQLADDVDDAMYDAFDIDSDTRERIRTEIFLRTAEDPEDRELPTPDSVPEDLDAQVKDLVHHFAMEVVRDADDGVVPVEADDRETMLDRIVGRFHEVYGDHAADRLVEVDDVLGAASAADEAYPNLRRFVADDLFAYHVDRMENTPVVWKLTTERLVADATGEGFACFVDYHQLDAGVLDRLQNRYLEPRKAALRERRDAANRRRSDDSLGADERAEAAEAYERHASALEQIAVFEDVIQGLGDATPRDFDADCRGLAADLAPKVAAFREETARRLGVLDDLREARSEAWFEDAFSPGFWGRFRSGATNGSTRSKPSNAPARRMPARTTSRSKRISPTSSTTSTGGSRGPTTTPVPASCSRRTTSSARGRRSSTRTAIRKTACRTTTRSTSRPSPPGSTSTGRWPTRSATVAGRSRKPFRPTGPTARSRRSRPPATGRTASTASRSTSRRWPTPKSFPISSTRTSCNHARNENDSQTARNAIDEAAAEDPVALQEPLRAIVEHTGVVERHIGALATRCFENDRLQVDLLRTAVCR